MHKKQNIVIYNNNMILGKIFTINTKKTNITTRLKN